MSQKLKWTINDFDIRYNCHCRYICTVNWSDIVIAIIYLRLIEGEHPALLFAYTISPFIHLNPVLLRSIDLNPLGFNALKRPSKAKLAHTVPRASNNSFLELYNFAEWQLKVILA